MARLVDHLKSLGMSNRDAGAALKSGKVYYRGVPTADAAREVEPAEVVVDRNARRIRVGVDPVILHKDEHLLVVWKPSGMLSVPAVKRGAEGSLLGWLSKRFGGAYAVHRLDEPTSGVMLYARTEACQGRLKALFERHAVDRRYLAIVAGHPPAEERVTRSVLVRDRGDGKRGSAEEESEAEALERGGREAVTHLRRLEKLGAHASLVEARLETGRTHQVRIHLSEAGHSVYGDPVYGPPGGRRAAPRLALHARTLGFEHPYTHKPLHFDTPLPDDLERLARQLRVGPRGGGRSRRRSMS